MWKVQGKCNILSKSESSTTIQVVFFTIVLSILLILMYDRWAVTNNDNEIFILQREMQEYTRRSVSSLETKIDRIGDISDSYQISTGRRLTIVEQEIKTLHNKVDALEEEIRRIRRENNNQSGKS